jgi:hypothetical protein
MHGVRFTFYACVLGRGMDEADTPEHSCATR